MIQAIILLGLLIFFHELGHFLVAKYFKVYVEKFSIGFGPKLFSWKRGETEYMLSAIPLGGYVKMYGDGADYNPEGDTETPPEMKERAFNNKPLYARSLIVFAGPFANFLLAAIVYAVIFMAGVPRATAVIGELMPDMPAVEAGLLEGDKVISVDGKQVTFWDEMSSYIIERPGREIVFEIQRDDSRMEIVVTPRESVQKNVFGEDVKVGLVGVKVSDQYVRVNYGFFPSVKMGVEKTAEVTGLIITGVVKIFQKSVPADSIGGPIMILQMAKSSADEGVLMLLGLMAAISVNLAILNLLPIPVLDGGHLLFYAVEAVTRRPVSIKIREYANMAGMMFIFGLMFFAFYNDIIRIIKS
ncbi:RIP metalloprotease RseP [Geovibrio thiophilus]|uniref:Zinc metalloprotease n=1 Tax=Geovibrio thiophilus TaxID=139438 RepID=A0A410K1F7_9BACT|nr:RIP metalloprotease RseP [Geovibrio thiophilus]QAR34232.1 RIP metalloprotease RseP [Geovibrio thiophilus]